MKTVQVQFYVSGHVTTEVEIPDDLSIEDSEDGLLNGDYATSIVPNAPVINLMAGCQNIGKVVELTGPDLEYTDFLVEKIPLTKEEQEAEDYKTQKRISD